MSQKVKDYQLLFKFRLSLLVVFSSVMTYLLVAESLLWEHLVLLSVGGFLVTGAANALNQVLEKDFDKMMQRTADRPLATGRMTVYEAVFLAGVMSVIGTSLLALLNPLTALFGAISLLLYAFVYTPLKRVSPIAVIVGAIPGALPTLIGCVAYEGTLTALAIVLFGIQFFWQFPHFWAIAWLGHEDYTKAGYYLLPSSNGERNNQVGMQSFIYGIMLLPLGLLPYWMGISGLVSAILVSIVGIYYVALCWRLYKECTDAAAKQLMFASFFYLPVVLILFLIDKI